MSDCVSRDTRLTAMADLMACNWKKTLPPSSGHTILISSLVIPRRSFPVSTPRLVAVLRMKRHRISGFSCLTRYIYSTNVITLPAGLVHDFSHILLNPLYCSQALTSEGVEVMFRVTGPRLSRCWAERIKGRNEVTWKKDIGSSAAIRVTELTSSSSMGPSLFIGSRTFWGTWPSSSRALLTSHHCFDFWTTCKKPKEPHISSTDMLILWLLWIYKQLDENVTDNKAVSRVM